MNKKRIGIFIKELRIKKKYSEKQLADKLNISVKKLRSIEKGKFKFSEDLLYDFRKVFKVSMFEIINGCMGNEVEDKQNAALILVDELKKEGKKTKRIYIGLTILTTTIIMFCLGYLYNNRTWSYALSGESNNFSYHESFLTYNSGMYLFYFGDINIKNREIKEENIKYIRLMCDDRLIVGSSNILTGTLYERKGYGEYFPKDVVNNLDDWYYEITYVINDEEYTETIDIQHIKWD